MTLLSTLGRAVAVVTVVAGIALFTLAVHGLTRVDTRLELAAAKQAVPAYAADHDRAPAKAADCPFRDRDRDRERV